MQILAIETSCDETSLALVEATGGLRNPIFEIKKLLTASQIETHRPWGGVVPNLAKREHAENLPKLFKKIWKLEIGNWKFPDLIAVTIGPGLEPCLWQGIEFAKKIKKTHFPKAKIVPTNHLHGHMYSFLLTPQRHPERSECAQNDIFPAVQLLVSGGHTILIYMKSLTDYKKLGETRDDAAGEAFDKVARMLGLPYPGGPEIEKLAKKSQMSNVKGQMSIVFPRPMLHDKNYDFSFSGLKTSVLYYLKSETSPLRKVSRSPSGHGVPRSGTSEGESQAAISSQGKLTASFREAKLSDIAASFQNAVIDVLTAKTLRAAKEYDARSVILSGGVAANSALRSRLRQMSKVNGQMFISAEPKYQGDNAVMIAVAGYMTRLRPPAGGKKYQLKANGNLSI